MFSSSTLLYRSEINFYQFLSAITLVKLLGNQITLKADSLYRDFGELEIFEVIVTLNTTDLKCILFIISNLNKNYNKHKSRNNYL